jgi:hypothetical protein
MGHGFQHLRSRDTAAGCAIIEPRGEVVPHERWHGVPSFVTVGQELYAISPHLRNLCLYIDEAHAFRTLSFADLLPEARKFRLNLILAHQYLEEVEEEVRAAIFGNVGTLIAFRVGACDAEYLAQEFYPAFTQEDFLNLPPYAIYLKLMVDGVMSRGFSAKTLFPKSS